MCGVDEFALLLFRLGWFLYDAGKGTQQGIQGPWTGSEFRGLVIMYRGCCPLSLFAFCLKAVVFRIHKGIIFS